MLKQILATSALASILATGAFAQEAADPAVDPAVPVIEGAGDATTGDAVTTDPAPGLADDPAAMDPAAPTVADDPLADPAAPVVTDDGMAPADGTLMGQDPLVEDPAMADAWMPVDFATVSADRLMGVNIVNHEGETIASVDDVLITDDGSVESIVARFGGFLGFGSNRVLLTVDEVEIVQDANENLQVRTSLTPESIEGRPDYEPS